MREKTEAQKIAATAQAPYAKFALNPEDDLRYEECFRTKRRNGESGRVEMRRIQRPVLFRTKHLLEPRNLVRKVGFHK